MPNVKSTARDITHDGQRPAAPQVFDMAKRHIRRERAANRFNATSTLAFFSQRCAEDIAERLLDIARTFQNALIIAPPGFWPHVAGLLPAAKHPKNITTCYDLPDSTETRGRIEITAPDDALPFDPESFDLIISILSLHSVNDLPGALINMRQCLKPDGLMMASLFGGQSLNELRQSLYSAEANITGGVTPRVFPMIDFSQSAALLQRAGLALPVVDTDRFTVQYSSFDRLINDLRDQGETNILAAASGAPISKPLRDELITAYTAHSQHTEQKLTTTFEILWLTGWAPDASQQKPLKPGSAKMRLADALGAKEQKL
ncbi:MAG: methyltransferase domain-containing protein [Maricaulaceae bacterium]